MASLQDLKRRISSVKSTRKITKAMKMIAAVRLRKAAEAIQAARPYAVKLHEVLSHLALRTEGGDHPLLKRDQETKKVRLLVITSDRGLCGGFNGNILRYAEGFRRANEKECEITLSVIGKKGWEYFKSRNIPVKKQFLGIYEDLNFETAAKIADELVADYLEGEYDRMDLVYNEFKSAMSQDVTNKVLLPITPLKEAEILAKEGEGFIGGDYDYEPSQKELLEVILPRYFRTEIYRALLESVASELGARMTAMESATNNASEMIDRLTLVYNRARQAAITTELMEIIGGSEALKG